MFIPRPSRGVALTLGALALGLVLWIALPFFSPTRGVERAWDDLLEAIEDNDAEELGRLLGQDYSDGFGLDRAGAIELARTIRGHFVVCELRRERSEVVMDPSEKSAATRALIRLGGNGTPVAQNAIQASAASQTPTSFRWRRNSWKPWDWRLVRVENEDAARALASFQRQAGAMGLLP